MNYRKIVGLLLGLSVFLGTGVGIAGATYIDYGVALYQQYGADDPANQFNGSYCFPVCGLVPNGSFSVSQSENKAVSGTAPGSVPSLSGSTQFQNDALVTMGAIHVASSVTSAGDSGGTVLNQGFWSDVLTVGDNLPQFQGMPIQFLVTLDLSGSVSASSEFDKKYGNISAGSTSLAQAQSIFSLYDSYGANLSNTQNICSGSLAGKNVSSSWCPKGSSSPYDYSTVLTTYPGATVWVNDFLSTEADARGFWDTYACGNTQCVKTGSAASSSNFQDTAQFTFLPLTPGAFYSSASGTAYAQVPLASTPEPSTWALFGTGIALMAWVRVGIKKKSDASIPQCPFPLSGSFETPERGVRRLREGTLPGA